MGHTDISPLDTLATIDMANFTDVSDPDNYCTLLEIGPPPFELATPEDRSNYRHFLGRSSLYGLGYVANCVAVATIFELLDDELTNKLYFPAILIPSQIAAYFVMGEVFKMNAIRGKYSKTRF